MWLLRPYFLTTCIHRACGINFHAGRRCPAARLLLRIDKGGGSILVASQTAWQCRSYSLCVAYLASMTPNDLLARNDLLLCQCGLRLNQTKKTNKPNYTQCIWHILMLHCTKTISINAFISARIRISSLLTNVLFVARTLYAIFFHSLTDIIVK